MPFLLGLIDSIYNTQKAKKFDEAWHWLALSQGPHLLYSSLPYAAHPFTLGSVGMQRVPSSFMILVLR